jgi:indole-3-glycerol phosphate synthase/phosphoribosylanthranilate isomerase/anthranilate synthase/indole-3-glycerol phosphate synthase/phosphoribosylanthranilate isomerase
MVAIAAPPLPFAAALRPGDLGPARLIAEVKRASPSKGLLVEDLDPAAQAEAYADGGAAAISVLTEPHFFLGSLDDLAAVRRAVELPLLRKDFVLDEYQVYEARAAGADAILLIAAILDDTLLSRLHQLARQLGMDTLIEAHDQAEIERALRVEASVVGINSRDLKTFNVDDSLVARLGHIIPSDTILVSESGIADRAQATRARAWGADAILVGEALMRSSSVSADTRSLAEASGGAFARLFGRSSQPFVKLCGLTRPEHAGLAAQLHADAIGLVFAPSRRRIGSLAEARRMVEAASGLLAIGVFVNETSAAIASTAKAVGLGAIQLCGDETPAFTAEIAAETGLPVIKALRLPPGATPEALEAYALSGAALLLDTPSPDGYGGTGRVGDWSQAGRMAALWPIILSGGLTAQNVAAALATVRPAGVDVSSGIETEGQKDSRKMEAFVRAAYAAVQPMEASTSP